MTRNMTMIDTPDTQPAEQKSWLERLSQALLREPQDREQLVGLLRDAEERDLLEPEALTMIEGVLHVSEMRVRDIMIPRSQIVVIKEEAGLADIIPIAVNSSHSRFPVISENQDEVVGILLAKDLLQFAFNAEDKKFSLEQIIREPMLVPESKRLDSLLRQFRTNHNHMAIVVDEYGGTAGLVTIEDVLEQIVGEIEDEHDDSAEFDIKQHSENEYIVKALTPIEDFNKHFQEVFNDDEYDTIGGLVMHEFGRLPKMGEVVSFGRYDFKVLNADKRRIHLLQVKVN